MFFYFHGEYLIKYIIRKKLHVIRGKLSDRATVCYKNNAEEFTFLVYVRRNKEMSFLNRLLLRVALFSSTILNWYVGNVAEIFEEASG